MPETLDILGHSYKVKLVKNNRLPSDAMGVANIEELQIVIDKDLPLSRQRSVLLHEIVHVVADELIHPQLEEEVVQPFAAGLFQFFTKNRCCFCGRCKCEENT